MEIRWWKERKVIKIKYSDRIEEREDSKKGEDKELKGKKVIKEKGKKDGKMEKEGEERMKIIKRRRKVDEGENWVKVDK